MKQLRGLYAQTFFTFRTVLVHLSIDLQHLRNSHLQIKFCFLNAPFSLMDRDSSVRIVTRYGLDGQGIESNWGRGFPHPSRPAVGPTQPPVQRVPRLSRRLSSRGLALTTNLNLAPRLKKEYTYTTTSPLGLRGPF